MRSLILVITFSLVACQNIFYRSDLQPPLSSTSDNEAIATQATDANLNRPRRQAVSGVNITEEVAPIVTSVIAVDDQYSLQIAHRIPKGEGPFPVIIYVHGGHRYRSLENRINESLNSPSMTRLLAAGFGIVMASFRSYEQFEANKRGPVNDISAILEEVRSLPRIDLNSIIMLGHSSGGRLTLEAAGLPKPPTIIVVSEPASTLLAEIFPVPDANENREPYTPNFDVALNVDKYYTAEKQDILESKVRLISSPILLIHSDVHRVNIANDKILIPALTKYGKLTKEINYPGYEHSYLNGRGGITEEVMDMIINDIISFSNRYIKVKAIPLL